MFRPKSEWPPGPWHDEPDEREWECEGLRCRVKRGAVGAWCGYVGVPKTHPVFGSQYDGMEDWYSLNENQQWWLRHVTAVAEVALLEIQVHGGLTYAHTEEDGWHYFGFDCAHAYDTMPALDLDDVLNRQGGYKDMAYAVAETESLAKQLAKIKPRRGTP